MDEKSRRISECLEDHLDVWRSDPEFMAKYKVVVDYIRNILKLDLEEDKILRVITSSYTNDFSHTLPNGNQVITFPPEPPEPPEHLVPGAADVPPHSHDEPLLPALHLQASQKILQQFCFKYH